MASFIFLSVGLYATVRLEIYLNKKAAMHQYKNDPFLRLVHRSLK